MGKYLNLKSHLDNLPKSRESFGLIHQDAHAGNLFVDDKGRITVFDFDDYTYSWFINDIAIVLFYIAIGVEDQAAFTKEFMAHFLRGYWDENHLEGEWLQETEFYSQLDEHSAYYYEAVTTSKAMVSKTLGVGLGKYKMA